MNPACGLIAAILLTSPAIQAVNKPKQELAAKDIGQGWLYKRKSKESFDFWMSQSASSRGSSRLHAFSGHSTYGTYVDAWNFYAAKCGSDRKWQAPQFSLQGPRSMEEFTGVIEGKTKQGEYLIVGQGSGSAMFVYRTDGYSVSVTLQSAQKGEGVFFTVTVAMK